MIAMNRKPLMMPLSIWEATRQASDWEEFITYMKWL